MTKVAQAYKTHSAGAASKARNYAAFLERKSHLGGQFGFAPRWMPDFLFDFQKALVEWALLKGRAAIFADCGLGKTPMQLVWAQNVIKKSNRPVLILTPLAVAAQTLEQAERFGIKAAISREGETGQQKLILTNYERLHYFDPSKFAGVVCDESSAIKAFDGKRRALVTDFLRKMEYRLLCTATAAPNDYIELGTSSEALGELGYTDMLTRFFRNDQNTSRAWHGGSKFSGSKWRFKGHAEEPFWRWVCSWARAVRRPSDLGFDDAAFILPDLIEREHIVKARTLAPGFLFEMPPADLREERAEQRRTLTERCEKVAELVSADRPAVAWCYLNSEGDLLERLIPDCVQVKGSDSIDQKEEALTAFSKGQYRKLVIKPKIGAWGLNWQHCAHMTFFPSHSYEQYYQAVRRCWRFGQESPVQVDVVTTESGHDAMVNLQRKANQADRMFSSLVSEMNQATSIPESGFAAETRLPAWL